jgi:hypothetical protein
MNVVIKPVTIVVRNNPVIVKPEIKPVIIKVVTQPLIIFPVIKPVIPRVIINPVIIQIGISTARTININPTSIESKQVFMIEEGQSEFLINASPIFPEKSKLFLNGQLLSYGIDYQINDNLLLWMNGIILNPVEYKLELFYI